MYYIFFPKHPRPDLVNTCRLDYLQHRTMTESQSEDLFLSAAILLDEEEGDEEEDINDYYAILDGLAYAHIPP